MKTTTYEGFRIEKEAAGMYAVRYRDETMDWCGRIPEAKGVVNRILQQPERWIEGVDEKNKNLPKRKRYISTERTQRSNKDGTPFFMILQFYLPNHPADLYMPT